MPSEVYRPSSTGRARRTQGTTPREALQQSLWATAFQSAVAYPTLDGDLALWTQRRAALSEMLQAHLDAVRQQYDTVSRIAKAQESVAVLSLVAIRRATGARFLAPAIGVADRLIDKWEARKQATEIVDRLRPGIRVQGAELAHYLFKFHCPRLARRHSLIAMQKLLEQREGLRASGLSEVTMQELASRWDDLVRPVAVMVAHSEIYVERETDSEWRMRHAYLEDWMRQGRPNDDACRELADSLLEEDDGEDVIGEETYMRWFQVCTP